MRCPACGVENPEQAKFCMACAAALATIGSQTRKTVTILFSDVKGSTSLGERLDPESLRGVIGRYFDACREVLIRHGGTVEKFIGDAVMAVFGVPTVHEDDALRAIRAADEIRSTLDELNVRFEQDHGIRIEVRTGVNTGEVMAGDPGSGQPFVSGDAVNVAARLEQAAAAGEILLSSTTWELIRNAVEVQEIEPLPLKGKSEPVRAFRLIAVSARDALSRRSSDSRFVGRQQQLDQLVAAFDRVESDRRCQLFTVLGEPGVGKSRLVSEFVAGVGGRATVLEGRCLSYGEGITFLPVADVLAQAIGSTADDDRTSLADRLRSVVGDTEEARLIVERLLRMLGSGEGDSQGSAEEIYWAVRRLLEIVGSRGPVVVIFDDIQWAEPALLDLIEHVCDLSSAAPILLLCMARPDLIDERPGWGAGKANAGMVVLEPLSVEDCGALLEGLVGGNASSGPLQQILASAGGNPLFVEQMVAHLIEEGIIVRSDDRWEWREGVSAPLIPASLKALLAARLDRVSERERVVLQRGSIEGQVFHRGSVTTLAPPERKAEIGPSFGPLMRKELLVPEAAEFAGEDAFRFRHLLIRDAAYDSMPKELRGDLHERFAGWLAQRAGDRLPEFEELVGYHLEEAQRYLTELGGHGPAVERLRAGASMHLSEAGRAALRRGDLRAAGTLLTRAADLTNDVERRLWLLIDALPALDAAGDTERVHRAVAQMDESLARTDSDHLRARSFVARQDLYSGEGSEVEEDWSEPTYRSDLDGAIQVLEASETMRDWRARIT